MEELRLIISTREASELYDVSSTASSATCVHREPAGEASWRIHPTSPDKLIMRRGTEIKTYSTGTTFESSSISSEETSLTLLHRTQDYRASDWDMLYLLLELWVKAGQSVPVDNDAKRSFGWLSQQCEQIIGLQKSNDRIIFLHWDKWICTIDRDGFKRRTFQRHFFIPYHWISPGRTPLIRVNAVGKIALAKDEELVVITKGLDSGVEENQQE